MTHLQQRLTANGICLSANDLSNIYTNGRRNACCRVVQCNSKHKLASRIIHGFENKMLFILNYSKKVVNISLQAQTVDTKAIFSVLVYCKLLDWVRLSVFDECKEVVSIFIYSYSELLKLAIKCTNFAVSNETSHLFQRLHVAILCFTSLLCPTVLLKTFWINSHSSCFNHKTNKQTAAAATLIT